MLRSRGSIVFFVFTFIFASLRDSCALPTLLRREQEHGFDYSKYTVPLSDGPSSLPPPSPTLALKAITLARGFQNYTCNPTTPPTAAGALATLYDATPLLSLLCSSSQQQQQPPSSISQPQAVLDFLTHYLYYFAFPSFLTTSPSSQHKNKNENDNDNDEDDGAEKTDKGSGGGAFRIPIIGQHFFDAAHVPTWDLGPAQLGVLKGKKVGGVASAEKGSVDWLVLDRVDDGGSGPLKEVYRVETVGGVVGGECEGKGEGETVRVRYASQYWFYG